MHMRLEQIPTLVPLAVDRADQEARFFINACPLKLAPKPVDQLLGVEGREFPRW